MTNLEQLRLALLAVDTRRVSRETLQELLGAFEQAVRYDAIRAYLAAPPQEVK